MSKQSCPQPNNGWYVQIPLSELAALQGLPQQIQDLQNENKRLQDQLTAMRVTMTDMMQLFGDLRREIRRK